MNNLYTNNKSFIFQLIIGASFFYNALNGITFNNTPLHELIQPDQYLTFTPHSKENVTVFRIENGNITLGSGNISQLTNLEEIFKQQSSGKSCLIRSKVCNISSNSVDHNGSYLVAQERMIIKAKTSLNFVQNLLESPNISATGNQMNFVDCFLINPQLLEINANSSESICQTIRITFNEKITHPTLLTGKIDLEKKHTEKELWLTNVKKIEIHFSSKAWNK